MLVGLEVELLLTILIQLGHELELCLTNVMIVGHEVDLLRATLQSKENIEP